jgi:hypothetical protein
LLCELDQKDGLFNGKPILHHTWWKEVFTCPPIIKIIMNKQNSIIAVFNNHKNIESAVKELAKNGIDISQLSIIGKDYHSEENVVGYYNTGDRIRYWGGLGAFWGSIWGLLAGAAFLWVPGIGPLVVGGPFITVLLGAAEGALLGGGLSVLGAALFSLGVPQNSILKYEEDVKAGKFLLIFKGTEEERTRVSKIMEIFQAVEELEAA